MKPGEIIYYDKDDTYSYFALASCALPTDLEVQEPEEELEEDSLTNLARSQIEDAVLAVREAQAKA